VSIPKFTSRKDSLRLIGSVGIDITYSTLGHDLDSLYIDQVWEITNDWEPVARIGETLKILNHLDTGENDRWSSDDSFIVVTPDKQLVRFEDLVRDKPGMILLKGSFNPIHEYHLLMMDDTKKLYPDYAAAFLCSITRYDKPNVPIQELLQKIDKITSLGYYMVISKKWLYADTVKWIRQRWKEHKIVFPIGMDTLNRIIDSTPKKTDRQFGNVIWWYDLHSIGFSGDTKFLVFNRKDIEPHADVEKFGSYYEIATPSKEDTGISSTKIRNGELNSTI
jgi:nicotinic acid mononucleotide adenylyltransferase